MKIVVGLDHVQIATPRGEEAAAPEFYEGLLGIPRVPKPTHLETRGGCWFESDVVRIDLGVEYDFRPAKKAHPALLALQSTVLESTPSFLAIPGGILPCLARPGGNHPSLNFT